MSPSMFHIFSLEGAFGFSGGCEDSEILSLRQIKACEFISSLAVLPGGLAKRCISGAINQHTCLKPKPTRTSASIPLRKEDMLIGWTEQQLCPAA